MEVAHIERQGHAERMSSGGSAMRGDATTSRHVERQLHIKRMSCKGSATRAMLQSAGTLRGGSVQRG